MKPDPALPIGIYEKALPQGLGWNQMLLLARAADYGFVEISVDESPERLQRLEWSLSERVNLHRLSLELDMPFLTLCLSGHRRYPLGSTDADIRCRAMQIMRDAIHFAGDVGVRIIQVAGYDVFYEPSTPTTRAYLLEGLYRATEYAGRAGVILGIENVDCDVVDSVTKAMQFVNQINSPWFQLMPDMGNLAAADYYPPSELQMGSGHLVGIHVKDALRKVIRGVPFEKGLVPFPETLSSLANIGFWGPMTVEMWSNMVTPDSHLSSISDVNHWLRTLLDRHFYPLTRGKMADREGTRLP